ncbi:alpha/beta hydrolase, partial [Eubacteriales bacterium OttesenSCG-928-N14]|nr:alpha/beta hydrolase [Eubacteriales bacterium OttesenSCG-928-N14]
MEDRKAPVIVDYDSANGSSTIHARIWEIDNPRGIVQIIHGMAEHAGRYDEFARFLNDNGFLVAANDHAGHGLSIGDGDIPGYMAEKDGWRVMMDDADVLHRYLIDTYGELPFFLLGHSMGAILAALYPIYYGEEHLDSVIVTGIPAKNPLLAAGKTMAKASKSNKPAKHIHKMAFGGHTSSYAHVDTEYDWINSIPEEVQQYIDDPLCGFVFTAQG